MDGEAVSEAALKSGEANLDAVTIFQPVKLV